MIARGARRAKAARILSQALFAGLFLYVFLRSRDPFAVVQNPFLRWDPLVALTSGAADLRVLLPPALLLVLAAVLGRVFCGWACPLGGLIDLLDLALSPLRRRNPAALGQARPRSLLVRVPPSLVLLGAGAVGVFTGAGILPFVHPLVWAVRAASLSALGIAFVAALAAGSAFGTRMWCVYACPLGALYGLLGRVPLLRLSIRSCRSCGACGHCPMQAADAGGRRVAGHQCTLCFAMEARCSAAGFAFGPVARGRVGRATGFDASRRRFLVTGSALAGGALLGGAAGAWAGAGAAATGGVKVTLRPPGVVDEEGFLRRCIRCHHCVESCPNRIIEPEGLEDGVGGFLAPRLRFTRYGCDFQCRVCQLVCPNGAIPLQALAEKQRTPIGLAVIDRQACVVFKDSRPCLVCEEVCPTPEKAVVFAGQRRVARPGGTAVLREPAVVGDRCIGCGICQAACPAPTVAITVRRLPPARG